MKLPLEGNVGHSFISVMADQRNSTGMKRLIPYPFTDSQKQESVINSIIIIAFVHIFPATHYDKDDTASKIATKLQSQMAFPTVDGKGTYTAQWVKDRYRQLVANKNEDYVKWYPMGWRGSLFRG